MSRHFDKAMTKLTSKEKEAVLEHGLRRAIQDGIRSLAASATDPAPGLSEGLTPSADPRAALAQILSDACRVRRLEAENLALQQRLRNLEARLEGGGRAATG